MTVNFKFQQLARKGKLHCIFRRNNLQLIVDVSTAATLLCRETGSTAISNNTVVINPS